MKRIVSLALAACLLAAITSCGKQTSLKDLQNSSQSSSDSAAVEIKIDNSDGYTAAMTAAAGLDMENASADDIVAAFGQPSETKTESRSDTQCTIMTYPFGTLYFEDRDGQQILTFAMISAELPKAIYGVNIGNDIYSAAEAFYLGSSEQVKEVMHLAETAQEKCVLFYGSSQDGEYIAPYGLFEVIDIDQASDECVYTLEYAVPSTSREYAHKISFTFGRDTKLTYIRIDCSSIF